MERWVEFSKLKTDTDQHCLTGDSRTINIGIRPWRKLILILAEIGEKQRIKAIFTSPPYDGLINYHEQHAYAYDLLWFQ